jgi:GGDEF domain-containing protein
MPAARGGGDEFSILLVDPRRPQASARETAQRLVVVRNWPNPTKASPPGSASIGIAVYPTAPGAIWANC